MLIGINPFIKIKKNCNIWFWNCTLGIIFKFDNIKFRLNLRKELLLNFFIGISFLPFLHEDLLANQILEQSEFEQKIYIEKLNSKLNSQYILGAGDTLYIKFEGIQIFSSIYNVNFQNSIFLPEINNLNVEGLTLLDLENILENKYQDTIKDPKISVILVQPRPITVHLGGEVNKTGLFTMNFKNKNNNQEVFNLSGDNLSSGDNLFSGDNSLQTNNEFIQNIENPNIQRAIRIFDLLKEGQGITKYADLSNISVTRINPESQGGGKIVAKVDILSLITKGDQSQNIALQDGDSVNVPKSNLLIRDQLISINKSNLTPDFIRVYVNGNVPRPGVFKLTQGSSMIEGIATAGGGETL